MLSPHSTAFSLLRKFSRLSNASATLSSKFNQKHCPSTLNAKNYSSHFTYTPDTVPATEGETVRMNLFQAVNNAMDIALATDPTACKLKKDHYSFQSL